MSALTKATAARRGRGRGDGGVVGVGRGRGIGGVVGAGRGRGDCGVVGAAGATTTWSGQGARRGRGGPPAACSGKGRLRVDEAAEGGDGVDGASSGSLAASSGRGN